VAGLGFADRVSDRLVWGNILASVGNTAQFPLKKPVFPQFPASSHIKMRRESPPSAGPAVVSSDRLSADNQSYEADVSHPSLGEEAVPGRVTLSQFALRFQSESVNIEIPFSHLLIPPGENKLTDDLIFRDARDPDWAVRLPDCGILEHRVFSSVALLRSRVHAIAGRRAYLKALLVTVGFFAAALAIGLSVSWVGHHLVMFAVSRVSPQTEKDIGDKYYRDLRKYVIVSQDPEMIDRLNSIFDQLRPGLPDPKIAVQFHVIETPAPNAASLPGHIFVTRGLFDVISTPDELEGVLAHEVAHITQRHVLRRLVSNEGPAAAIKAIFQDSDGTVSAIAQTSQFIVGRSFSREYEREADAMGWKYLIAANINPRGMIDSLVKLRDASPASSTKVDYLATHPDINWRIERLEGWWSKLDKKTGYIDLEQKMR
jgi:Zn-dependent protease with chaperone function